MGKIIRFMLTPLLVVSMFTTVLAASSPNIMVGNKTLSASAVIKEDRVLVPLRAIFESLNARVDYDAKTKTITGYQNDKIIILKVNNKLASVNGQRVTLDVPARIIKGSTLVPVRFIGESLGANVDWYNNTVLINSDRDKIPVTVKPVKTKKDELVEATKESIVGQWKEVALYTEDGNYKELPHDHYYEYTFLSNNRYLESVNSPILLALAEMGSHSPGDKSIRYYEIVNGKLITVIDGKQFTPHVVKMSKDGNKLYIYHLLNTANVYERQ